MNLADRSTDTLVQRIADLWEVMRKVKTVHPFSVVAMVVLPEHLHAIWRLPPGDADYPMRWSLLKAGFSRRLDKVERRRPSRLGKPERGIWQRRSWASDPGCGRPGAARRLRPLQSGEHGWTKRPADWLHSTLHAYIARGMAAPDWGAGTPDDAGGYGER